MVSDGAGGSPEVLKISALAVRAFINAVRRSSLSELHDAAKRDVWLRNWTKRLHAEAWERFQGGYATFCGTVVLPPLANPDDRPPLRPGWKLFTLNVGDSQVMKLTGDGKCMGITPDAPPNNANVEGHNPIRVVGKEPKGEFCLMDVEEFPLPTDGPCWILAGSDGFFSKKRGKDELCIFSSGDLRDVCLSSSAPFQDLPALAIRRSLANAQKLGCAEMMDNATVAMLGFRVPLTNLSAPVDGRMAESSDRRGPAGSPPASLPSAPAARPQPSAASKPTQATSAAQSTAKRPGAAAGAKRPPTFRIVLAAVIALVLGLLLGRSCAPVRKVETQVHSGDAGLPKLVRGEIPDKGRCRYCLANKDILPAGENCYHWAKDCPHRANWAE